MSEPGTTGHESRDLDPRAVACFAAGLVLTLIVVFIAMRFFIAALSGSDRTRATRIDSPRIEPPPPRLQTSPTADLAALRAAEETTLHGYGWVDRPNGIIRIPIERAIDLTLERGLPARSAMKGAQP